MSSAVTRLRAGGRGGLLTPEGEVPEEPPCGPDRQPSVGKENKRTSCFEAPQPRKWRAVGEDRPRRRCPSTESCESNNSIDSELTHFRPIKAAPLSPPKRLEAGAVRPRSRNVVMVRPRRMEEGPAGSRGPRATRATRRGAALPTQLPLPDVTTSPPTEPSANQSPPGTNAASPTSPLASPSLECTERLVSSQRGSPPFRPSPLETPEVPGDGQMLGLGVSEEQEQERTASRVDDGGQGTKGEESWRRREGYLLRGQGREARARASSC